MKKYTVVYGEFFQTGSHTNSITVFKHIETDDLNSYVEELIGWGSVWFVFEGHCAQVDGITGSTLDTQ